MGMPDIVLIAAGSPDPRHAEGVERLADVVRSRVRLGRAVGACYLGHNSPTAAELAEELNRSVIAVPVLLAPGALSRVDVHSAARDLGNSGAMVRVSHPLGPDPKLFDACDELLRAAGEEPDPDTTLIVYCQGSPDPADVEQVAGLMQGMARPGWAGWSLAAMSGGATVEEAVERAQGRRVVAVPLLVADGPSLDEMRRRCDALGVRLVPGTLSDTQVLADLVVARTNGA